MLPEKNRIYFILSVACMAGYAWLFYGMKPGYNGAGQGMDVCLVKHLTNMPCPSCGSTRSVISLLHGDIAASLYQNPFGIMIALIMLVVPLWILYDVAGRKRSLPDFYLRVERMLKKPHVALPLALFVIINWIWNISKGL